MLVDGMDKGSSRGCLPTTDHWDLRTLNVLAYQSGFMDYRAFQAAERIRKFRNMDHPNWYAARKPMRYGKGITSEAVTRIWTNVPQKASHRPMNSASGSEIRINFALRRETVGVRIPPPVLNCRPCLRIFTIGNDECRESPVLTCFISIRSLPE